jgi:hypothetical protein
MLTSFFLVIQEPLLKLPWILFYPAMMMVLPIYRGANAPVKGSVDNDDDAGVVGTASAETLVPGLIRTDTPNLPGPSVADRVPNVLSTRGHG